MPLYEFKCRDCSHGFEVLTKVDAVKVKCEKCSSSNVEKLVSNTSFQLKGSGWYRSGYAKTTGSSDQGSDKSGSSES